MLFLLLGEMFSRMGAFARQGRSGKETGTTCFSYRRPCTHAARIISPKSAPIIFVVLIFSAIIVWI